MTTLNAILARVRTTPVGLDPDDWMSVAAPHADKAERAALIARLENLPGPDMRRDGGRIRALQGWLKANGFAGFVVPRADEHMGEYLLPGNERLHWLTGFTGSAGTAVVMRDQAALFIDGRYTLQGPAQTDAAVIACRHFQQPAPSQWMAGEVKHGDRIGYDPQTFSVNAAESWRKALEAKGARFEPLTPNPIDGLWRDRPGDPFAAIRPHDDSHAGESSANKRAQIAAGLKAIGAGALVLNQLDSIAWLLNIRGGDTPNTPLAQGFVMLREDGNADWFVDAAKFSPDMRQHLGPQVHVRPLTGFAAALKGFAGQSVMLDPETAPMSIEQALRAVGSTVLHLADPCIALKARKNAVEQEGCRAAHKRDGAAMVEFLSWLDGAISRGEPLDEMLVAQKLEKCRRASPLYRGASFSTISAAGPNAALPHYRFSAQSNRKLEPGTLYLIDSGGQYVDGTTDITRTVAVGAIAAALKHDYTLVLKGHLAVTVAQFPLGAYGSAIDALARQQLWAEGKDFDHGTGHGVGSYLGVHETAARLAKTSQAVIEPGMLLSNEPGLYIDGSHGVRIENLVLVQPAKAAGFLHFETVTLCPYDRNAIAAASLTKAERALVDAYHARVREELSPLVSDSARRWLETATAPL